MSEVQFNASVSAAQATKIHLPVMWQRLAAQREGEIAMQEDYSEHAASELRDMQRSKNPFGSIFGAKFESYVTVECAGCEQAFEVRASESVADNRKCGACKFADEQEAKLPKPVCPLCHGTGRVQLSKWAEFLLPMGHTIPRDVTCECRRT